MGVKSILACVAATPLLMGAAEPVRLQPVSPWVLEYAEDSCRLVRTFGNLADPTILLFQSASPGELNMLAVGNALRTRASAVKIPARFLPVVDQPIEGQAARSSHGKKPAVFWSTVGLPPASEARERELAEQLRRKGQRPPPLDLAKKAADRLERQAFAAKVTAIQIEARRNRPVILETDSLGRAIQMLDQCTRDQLRHWGVDPNVEDKIVRSVWAPAAHSWFGPGDYPRENMLRGEQSVVEARLLVDATGKPTKCTSLSHFNAPEFQTVVCNALMTRAQFHPAELASGTRVPSYYAVKIQWRISEGPPGHPAFR